RDLGPELGDVAPAVDVLEEDEHVVVPRGERPRVLALAELDDARGLLERLRDPRPLVELADRLEEERLDDEGDPRGDALPALLGGVVREEEPAVAPVEDVVERVLDLVAERRLEALGRDRAEL